jgi:hypothetical protein
VRAYVIVAGNGSRGRVHGWPPCGPGGLKATSGGVPDGAQTCATEVRASVFDLRVQDPTALESSSYALSAVQATSKRLPRSNSLERRRRSW